MMDLAFQLFMDVLTQSGTYNYDSLANIDDGSCCYISSSSSYTNSNVYCQMEPLYDFLQSIDTVVLYGEGDSI